MTTSNDVTRFKIGDKIYTTAALEEISLRDILRFEAETAAEGIPMRFSEVQALADELAATARPGAKGRSAIDDHPQALMLLAVTIWASRRTAGEDITFVDAIDFPIVDLEFLPVVTGGGPGPTKAARKKKGPAKSTPRSAQAARARANAAASTPTTSAETSAVG